MNAPPPPRCLGVALSHPDVVDLVRRVFLGANGSGWPRRLRRAGLDPEDTLQDVYRGLLARNAGRRPYDPTVSSLPTYVFVVVRSVCLNALDAQRRAAGRGWILGPEEDLALRHQEDQSPRDVAGWPYGHQDGPEEVRLAEALEAAAATLEVPLELVAWGAAALDERAPLVDLWSPYPYRRAATREALGLPDGLLDSMITTAA